MFKNPLILLAISTLALASACKSPAQRRRVLTKDQEQLIAKNVLTKPPGISKVMKVNFDNKIQLLGYDLKGIPARGKSFDLALYFRVDNPVRGDWKVFVHFEAPGKRRQPFDHYGVGNLYPVGQWKKGEIIRDIVKIDVPADWPQGPTQLMVGFFDWGAWSKAGQNRRLQVDARDKKKATADNRVILTTLQITGKPSGTAAGGARNVRPPRPRLASPIFKVRKVAAAPTIDGKLDESAWAAIRPTRKFHQPDAAPLNPAYETTARLARDDTYLYVAFTTRDDAIANRFHSNDATLWEGDAVEFFVQPEPSTTTYYEFQWAPNGAHFDASFTAHRKPAWQQAAKWNAVGSRSAVTRGEGGWTVEAALPFAALGLPGAPAAGTKWPANLYRIDSKGPHNMAFMGAWAPVGGDFHNLNGAGTLEFVD